MGFFEALTTFLGGLGGTLLLLTPGYVLGRTFSRSVLGPELSERALIAAMALGGLVTHVLMLFWTIPLARAVVQESSTGDELSSGLLVQLGAWTIVVLMLVPALLGLLLSIVSEARSPRWLFRLLKRAGLSSVTRTAEAWNWIFSELDRTDTGSWVRVRLKDNAGIYLGKFGHDSFAASDANLRDLYLEETWPVDAYGIPKDASPANRGVWISGEQILSIEFVKLEEES